MLALSLPVDRTEIDALGERVRNLVAGLPDVDEVLNQSNENLELARQLLNDARKAR